MAAESASDTSGFMAAEKAAEYLVDSLKRLDDEAHKYTSAGRTLEQTSGELRELASRIADVAKRAGETIEALRGSGAAQVHERLDSLERDLGKLGRDLNAAGTAAEKRQASLREITTTLEELRSGLAEVKAAQPELAKDVRVAVEEAESRSQVIGESARAMAKGALVAAIIAAVSAAVAAIVGLVR
ncbi:MAG: hypothetical protein JXB46_08690 [Candidatus Eisenbacteria bacterium]|nr:hypothetical protein [Candidatus Eisenbacteria bacterium]